MTKTLDELMRIAGDEPAEWGPTGYTNAALESELRELIADADREEPSRAMFVARLENMDKSGDKWISVVAVLALLNDCDMLAARKG